MKILKRACCYIRKSFISRAALAPRNPFPPIRDGFPHKKAALLAAFLRGNDRLERILHLTLAAYYSDVTAERFFFFREISNTRAITRTAAPVTAIQSEN